MRHTNLVLIAALAVAAAPGQQRIGDANPNGFATNFFSTYVLFAANDGSTGMELHRIDAATMTRSLLKDIAPGAAGSAPAGFTILPGFGFVFAATDAATGRELWRTDGTTPGTVRVADIAAGPASSKPDSFATLGGRVLFAADNGAVGRELFATDGITVTLLADIRSGTIGSDPADLVAWNGFVYFTADDGVHGRELWRSDGTAVGTTLVQDLILGGVGSGPSDLTPAGSRLLFAATTTGSGRELCMTDGTLTGVLADIRPGGASSGPSGLVYAGLTWFVADDGAHGPELWRTDGTPAGTVLAADIRPGSLGSGITSLTNGPSPLSVWFVADDGVHGREPWQDVAGSAAMVADLVAGAGSAEPHSLTAIDFTNRMLFVADTGTGEEPWVSDGTPNGTGILLDIYPGPRSSYPSELTRTDTFFGATGFGALFAATDGTTGIEPWRTTGTAATTTRIDNIAPDLPGTQQPGLHADALDASGNLTLCIEGSPFAIGGLAIDFAPGPGIVFPFATGVYLLGLSPPVFVVTPFDPLGVACIAVTVPTAIGTIDLVAQAFEISGLGTVLLSDLAAIGRTSVASSTLGGGPVHSVGAYSDDNHYYDVYIDLPTTAPATGRFEFYNSTLDQFADPTSDGDFYASSGHAVHLQGTVPKLWKGSILLYFVDEKGIRHFLWRSYC